MLPLRAEHCAVREGPRSQGSSPSGSLSCSPCARAHLASWLRLAGAAAQPELLSRSMHSDDAPQGSVGMRYAANGEWRHLFSLKGLETVGMGWTTGQWLMLGGQQWGKNPPWLSLVMGVSTRATVSFLACRDITLPGHCCGLQLSQSPKPDSLSFPGQLTSFLSALLWKAQVSPLFSSWAPRPLIASLLPVQKDSLTLCCMSRVPCMLDTSHPLPTCHHHVHLCFGEIPHKSAGVSPAVMLLAAPHSDSISLLLLFF